MLKALPDQRFETPVWKRVSVHAGDQFANFDAMRFSLPPAWRGRALWARYAAPMLRLFDDQERLIRQYVVEPGKRLYWVDEDFPAEVRQMIDGGYPAWILEQGRPYGQAHARPHAGRTQALRPPTPPRPAAACRPAGRRSRRNWR